MKTTSRKTFPYIACRLPILIPPIFYSNAGITKTDPLTDKIIVAYETAPTESLLSVLLKEMVDSHVRKSNEKRNIATQSEIRQDDDDYAGRISAETSNIKSPPKARTNRSLYTREYKPSKLMKQKRPKDLTLIVNTLENMSKNISLISEKLDDCKEVPSNSDSQSTIVGCVGTIMNQLTSVIGNFENLCKDIKHINESKDEKNFENWMDDLQGSDNGKRLVKKLQKTFSKVVDDEKIKIKREYQIKLDREKNKLSKYYSRSHKNKKVDEVDIRELSMKITKEIGEIYESTCQKMKSIDEGENEFLKSLEKDKKAAFTVEQLKIDDEHELPQARVNLDECRQIHSTEESSIKSTEGYTSSDFESDDDDN